MIKTIVIIVLAMACLALGALYFWQKYQNDLLRERLYDAEEELELAPIPWGGLRGDGS